MVDCRKRLSAASNAEMLVQRLGMANTGKEDDNGGNQSGS